MKHLRTPQPGGATGRHLPGLDGLRGVAVLGVLAFHSRWSWAAGGFLGVSLFFTLSGFLITRLLVLEHRDRATIDLRAFFSRRARRLLPAAFAAIALAVAVTTAVGTPSQARDVPRDALASSFYVANWSFLLRGSSYATLFDAASPLQHMWSLAIEEQLYLFVPVLLAACFATRVRHATIAVVAMVTVGLALVSVVTAAGSAIDTLYYGTHVRAVELLIGVLLALAVTAPERHAPRGLARWGGPAALVVLLAGWNVARSSDERLFQGPIILHAVLVATVLWSVIDGVGPLSRVLGWRPLEWLGRRSYGIYVFHWPLFLYFEQLPSAPPRPVALASAWGLTLLIASASYRVLEQPIRTRAALPRPRVARGLAFAVPVLLVVAAVAAADTAPDISDPVAAAARLDQLTATPTTTTPVTSSVPAVVPASADEEVAAPAPTTGPPPRIAIFGDSTAATTGLGLAQWAAGTASFVPVPGVNAPGCPMVARGSRYNGDQELRISEGCDWRRSWPDTIASSDPDVIVISTGGLDALPWSLPGVEGRFTLGDELVDDIVGAEIDAINDVAVASGARVVWLTAAPPVLESITIVPLQRLNRMIRAGANRHPSVEIIDFASHIAAWPYEIDADRRSDGGHLDEDASLQLAEEWLGPKLLELVNARSAMQEP